MARGSAESAAASMHAPARSVRVADVTRAMRGELGDHLSGSFYAPVCSLDLTMLGSNGSGCVQRDR
jgi:hypothetical protein